MLCAGEQDCLRLRHFNEVFLFHDPAALTELVAEDCII